MPVVLKKTRYFFSFHSSRQDNVIITKRKMKSEKIQYIHIFCIYTIECNHETCFVMLQHARTGFLKKTNEKKEVRAV